MTTPITPHVVFVALGSKDNALACAVESVCKFSPATPIHVVSDVEESWLEGVTHAHVAPYRERANAFVEAYDHLSFNPIYFERTCFMRWFVLLEYAAKKELSTIWSFDWDVLVFDDLSKCMPNMEMSATEHVFFCRNLDMLRDWCDFVLLQYQSRGEAYQEAYTLFTSNEHHCISDMWWMHRRWPYTSYRHLTRIWDGAYFDHNMTTPDNGFEIRNGSKLIEWRDHLPWAWNEQRRSWIRCRCLHCWGSHRKRMREYLSQ